jgi:2-methylisocitrate lyase-like PEP mutase family enzyme
MSKSNTPIEATMPTHQQKYESFRALHQRPGLFIIPNPWDAGSAKILTALGFEALATTSAGFAFSAGLPDSAAAITREALLENARAIADATDLPVSADLQNGFGSSPDTCVETILLAAKIGLVGGSIEDATKSHLRAKPRHRSHRSRCRSRPRLPLLPHRSR